MEVSFKFSSLGIVHQLQAIMTALFTKQLRKGNSLEPRLKKAAICCGYKYENPIFLGTRMEYAVSLELLGFLYPRVKNLKSLTKVSTS